MLAALTDAPWLNEFRQIHTKKAKQLLSEGKKVEQSLACIEHKPVIIVGTIINKSREHIETDIFIKDLERALIKEGVVRIVANSTFKEKLLSERVRQATFASPETQKRLGRELGEDHMLFGTINTIVDTEGNNKVVFYQTNLELAVLETHELVWVGAKNINIKGKVGESRKHILANYPKTNRSNSTLRDARHLTLVLEYMMGIGSKIDDSKWF